MIHSDRCTNICHPLGGLCRHPDSGNMLQMRYAERAYGPMLLLTGKHASYSLPGWWIRASLLCSTNTLRVEMACGSAVSCHRCYDQSARHPGLVSPPAPPADLLQWSLLLHGGSVIQESRHLANPANWRIVVPIDWNDSPPRAVVNQAKSILSNPAHPFREPGPPSDF